MKLLWRVFALMRILFSLLFITTFVFVTTHTSGSGAASVEDETDPLKARHDALRAYRSVIFGTLSIRDLEEKFPNIEAVVLQYHGDERARILAITLAYFHQIAELAYTKNSAAFLINDEWIYYDEGRMTSEAYLGDARYHSIFYPYSLMPLTEVLPPVETLEYTRPFDFYQALLGASCCTRSINSNKRISTEIAHATREHDFLGKTVRMHPIAGKALQAVSTDLQELRKSDATVKSFVLKITKAFGYANKTVLRSQSSNISMHALGLAVDIIPRSYAGKEVYWVWTRNNYPSRWKEIPLEQRWNVPDSVVQIFQKHGFIWGGKWRNFDTIHFEYRPELILYARMIQRHGSNGVSHDSPNTQNP